MASISVDKKTGLKRLLFNLGEKRVTIHMGKPYARKPEEHSMKDRRQEAQAHRIFCAHIDALITASDKQESIAPDTAVWVKGLAKGLLGKLGALGLTQERRRGPISIGTFVDEYLQKKTNIRERTRINLKQTRGLMVEFFGDKDMAKIYRGDAEDFRSFLISQKKLTEGSTVSRHMGRARQYFEAAIRRKIITENPFKGDGMPSCKVRGNPERFYFVTQAEAQKLIDVAPSTEWRLLIALARYGGLRTPSEPLALRWADVNWERSRIRIPSSKTAHQGKDHRWIPMFPELRPYLQDAFDEAQDGSEWVITRSRDSDINLRTQLGRIAGRAGLTLWEKPWQNMRATRQTELNEVYPSHVVAKWMGNTESVANEHYLMLTDEHFERVAGVSEKPAQKAAQYKPETVRNGSKPSDAVKTKIADLTGKTGDLRHLTIPHIVYPLPPRRFELLLPG